jgi:hypothetical protein
MSLIVLTLKCFQSLLSRLKLFKMLLLKERKLVNFLKKNLEL